ncbi:hypothetical protein B566_EDAN009673 [Ephemera danica]|nr:hypothetical protein B566_EDAN009673 [Ephemera danica]
MDGKIAFLAFKNANKNEMVFFYHCILLLCYKMKCNIVSGSMAEVGAEISLDAGPPYVLEICGDDTTPRQEGVRECVLTLPTPDSPCGFHLSRTHWDPFPWVGKVEPESAADKSGLKSGDCLLRVNDHSLLGAPVATAARLVKGPQAIRLFVWSAGSSEKCKPDSLCCSPMPSALQKLSTAMSKILTMLECPICMDTIQPPAHQCSNGHLICLQCRARSEKCPVCRIKFGRGRSLLADQVFSAITEAFNINNDNSNVLEKTSNKRLRERLFGHLLAVRTPSNSDLTATSPRSMPKHRLLSRLLGKSHSVDNLSTIGSSHSVSAPISLQDTSKSLSSNEIFTPGSPIEHKRSFLFSGRPSSYHGSDENLSSRIEADFGPTVRYHCPLSCAALLITYEEIVKHMRQAHSAKHVIQIYDTKFEITPHLLPLVVPLCFFIDNHVFFVQKLSHWRASILANQEIAQNYELVSRLGSMEEQSNFLEILLQLANKNSTYGFHLIRTLWDPYPRVEKVEEDSLAAQSGVQIGDFVTQINGKSLLGISIQSILDIVKSQTELKLNIWRPGLENPNYNMINSILNLLGCPVCASSVAKLPRQCRNGHVICTPCVVRTDKCPICRAPLGKPANNARALPGARCLIAEQLTTALQTAGFVVPCNTNRTKSSDTDNEDDKANGDKGRSNFAAKLADFWRGNSTGGHHRQA